MASFIGAAMRLLTRRHPSEGHMAEEHAQQLGGRPHVVGEAAPAMPPAVHQQAPGPDRQHRPIYLHPEEDPLTLFRLMLGIQTTPYLGFTISSPIGTRPAPNIGLYARIVHSEQKAKDSFKVFSVVINACYFLQIVIAAALTALGAARASSGAVTAFGALNTVIAGFLTFLKGSGLPGRLKYYGNEWKKIREFIEQRERDFMRTGHNLNVYEVIETIEKMYNNLKADIELNTPDSYTSLTNQRRVGDNEKDTNVGGIDISKLESLATKLKGLDGLSAGLTKKADEAQKAIHEHEKQIGDEVENLKQSVVRDVQDHKARLDTEARDREARAREAISEGKRAVVHESRQAVRDGVEGQVARLDRAVDERTKRIDDAAGALALATIHDTGRAARDGIGIGSATTNTAGSMSSLVREIGEIHRTAVSGGQDAAAQQIRSLAHRLEGDHQHHGDDIHAHAHEEGERKPNTMAPGPGKPDPGGPSGQSQ